MAAPSPDAAALHRRALQLEWFTVAWNVIEAGVAITAGVIAGSAALVGFGVDSATEVSAAVALLWRLQRPMRAHIRGATMNNRNRLLETLGMVMIR